MPGRRRSPGEGSIFQRKDGKWVASIEVGEAFGARRRRRFIRSTREAARQELLKVQRAGVKRGAKGNIVTVSDLLDEWLEIAKDKTAHRTYAGYLEIANAYLYPTLGSIILADLEATDVERVVRSWMRSKSRRKERASAKSIKNRLTALRTALGLAVKRRLIAWNPASAVEPPTVPEYTAAEVTPEQFGLLLKAANTRFMGDYRAHLWVAAAAGLRRGEICALQWGDLDTESGVLTIGRSIEVQRPKPYRLAVKPPKNNRTEGVTLPSVALEALAKHREDQARRLVGVGPSTPIFDDDGKIMNPDKLGKRIASIVKRAGLKMRPLHDLRHAFGSWMTNEDVPSRVVQKQMRHSDPRMTSRYTKHVDEATRRAADKIDARLRKIRDDGSPNGSPEGSE